MQLDSVPVSNADLNWMDATRIAGVMLQVTPCQSQKLRESLRHDLRTPAGSLEMPDLKQRRACRSSSVLLVACADENIMMLEYKNMRVQRRKSA
jgi:hypothetical protein